MNLHVRDSDAGLRRRPAQRRRHGASRERRGPRGRRRSRRCLARRGGIEGAGWACRPTRRLWSATHRLYCRPGERSPLAHNIARKNHVKVSFQKAAWCDVIRLKEWFNEVFVPARDAHHGESSPVLLFLDRIMFCKTNHNTSANFGSESLSLLFMNIS